MTIDRATDGDLVKVVGEKNYEEMVFMREDLVEERRGKKIAVEPQQKCIDLTIHRAIRTSNGLYLCQVPFLQLQASLDENLEGAYCIFYPEA